MTANESSQPRLPPVYRAALCAAIAALLAGACGGTVGKSPSIGSESHFLAYCDQGCGVGLDCIGGICTRACLTERASCSDLAPAAACTNQSVEPGQVAVCDVSCRSGAGCDVLGADYACEGGYCRKPRSAGSAGSAGSGGAGTGSGGSSAGSGAEFCEPYRDQSPPPDLREIAITNTGSVPLYIQPPFPDCLSQYPLVDVKRDGAAVNVAGILFCGTSCQQVLDQGWPYSDPQGPMPGPCDRDCAGPASVLIEPGQTLRQPVSLEVVEQRMPRGCAEGIATDNIQCFSRVIPQPGNYELTVYAARQLECGFPPDCACRPDASGACTNPGVSARNTADLVFNFPSTWYFQNQTLEIGVAN